MGKPRSKLKDRVHATVVNALIKVPPHVLGEAVLVGLTWYLRGRLSAEERSARMADPKTKTDAFSKADEEAYEKLAYYRSVVNRSEGSSRIAVENRTDQSERSKTTDQKDKK